MKTDLSNALRAVTGAMETPVIVVLLILIAAALVLIATLIAEVFTERIRMKAKMPKLVDDLKAGERSLNAIIYDSGLLKRQKRVLYELNAHPEITPAMRESLAVRLLEEEKQHYDIIIMFSDMVARIAPMFGLLGTLIPLGPGIIALGQGDTYTLSNSLLTAFDTTAAGLLAAAAAFVVSAIRKKWYANYMSALEMVMECLLEVINTGDDSDEPKEDDYEDTYDQHDDGSYGGGYGYSKSNYDDGSYGEGQYNGGYGQDSYNDGGYGAGSYGEGSYGAENYNESGYGDGGYGEGQYNGTYAGSYGGGYGDDMNGAGDRTERFVWPEHQEADPQGYEWSAENNSDATIGEMEDMQAQQEGEHQDSSWTVVETEAPSYQTEDPSYQAADASDAGQAQDDAQQKPGGSSWWE